MGRDKHLCSLDSVIGEEIAVVVHDPVLLLRVHAEFGFVDKDDAISEVVAVPEEI